MKIVTICFPVDKYPISMAVCNGILQYRGLTGLFRTNDVKGFHIEFTDDISPELIQTVEDSFVVAELTSVHTVNKL